MIMIGIFIASCIGEKEFNVIYLLISILVAGAFPFFSWDFSEYTWVYQAISGSYRKCGCCWKLYRKCTGMDTPCMCCNHLACIWRTIIQKGAVGRITSIWQGYSNFNKQYAFWSVSCKSGTVFIYHFYGNSVCEYCTYYR